MAYKVSNEDASYKEVINSFLYRLTEMTAFDMPFSYHLDTFWVAINPYLSEADNKSWEDLCSEDNYQAWMNKLKLISLALYKNGLLPQKEHLNRYYKATVIGVSLGVDTGLKSYKIETVDMNLFVMRHLKYITYMTKNQRYFTIHVDALWNFLSPYITEEDYDNWMENNKVYGDEESDEHDVYRWNMEKLKIIMAVMERAGFLMEEGVIDNPEEKIRSELFDG